MTYIYAPSYKTVYFALTQFSIGEFAFITRSERINRFAEKAGIDCHYLKMEADDSVESLRLYKKELDKFSEQFNDQKIFFGFHVSAIADLYVLHQLKRRNKVSFQLIDPLNRKMGMFSTNPLSSSARFKTALKKKYEQVFDLDLDLYHNGLNYVVGMDVEQLEADFEKFEHGKNDKVWERNCVQITSQFGCASVDFIYIDNVSQMNGYTEKAKEVLDALVEKGKSVAIKPHPSIELHTSLSGYPILDADLPVECYQFLVNSAVVGGFSVALNHLSENVKAISLFNLFEIEDDKWKQKILNEFIAEKVHRPLNVDEAIKLCLE